MLAVLEEVVVVAKPGTELPSLPGVSVWLEPVTPQHPLIGIIHALALAGRRPIVTCATDMPFVPPRLIEQIASAPDGGAPAIVAAHDGELHPLLGRYLPQAAIPLAAAAATPGLPLREAVRGLGPRLIEVEDAEALFNINAPEDLLHASAMLDRRISRT
jgi:molybdopterin-guanine dinucleotide biosynthesis protein A